MGPIGKDKLVFDLTAVLSDNDNLGAFVRGADGDLITEHHIPEAGYASLISQGLVFISKLPGVVGNSYSFTVQDSTGSGPLSYTEVAGAIVLDLNGLTPTTAQVATALAGSAYANVTVGAPTGNVIVASIQSFSGGEATTIHHHLDVYSATADSLGNGITSHSDSSGSNSLDVHVTNPSVINVDIDGIYNNPNNLLPANVGLIGSTRSAPGVANQTLQFTGAGVGSDNVAVSNIVAQDVNAFGMVFDGSAWDRMPGNSTDGVSVKLTNSSIAVTGTFWQTTQPISAASLPALDAPNTAFNAINVSIPSTAGGTALFASPLAARKSVLIQNLGNQPIYVGPSGVSTTTGIRIAAGANWEIAAGPSQALYAISVSSPMDVRVFQISYFLKIRIHDIEG